MDFTNKTILLTGASSGIGKAIAEALSNYNSKLILLSRRIDLLSSLKEKLKNSKAEIHIVQCDVSNKIEVKTVFQGILKQHSSIDLAILNAGFGHSVKLEDYNSDFADETFHVNVLGMIYCIEQLLPSFLERKKGIIAGVSSLADNRGFAGSGFYCASKAAASIYLESLRVELSHYGVKVITIKPGFVKTAMTDKNQFEMPFLMQPDKAAQIIVKGIEKEKSIIQFPFPIILSTRLVGLLPNWFYFFLAKRVKV
jgi:short-subunit dehydrogenase